MVLLLFDVALDRPMRSRDAHRPEPPAWRGHLSDSEWSTEILQRSGREEATHGVAGENFR